MADLGVIDHCVVCSLLFSTTEIMPSGRRNKVDINLNKKLKCTSEIKNELQRITGSHVGISASDGICVKCCRKVKSLLKKEQDLNINKQTIKTSVIKSVSNKQSTILRILKSPSPQPETNKTMSLPQLNSPSSQPMKNLLSSKVQMCLKAKLKSSSVLKRPVSGGSKQSNLVPAVIKLKVKPSEEKAIADRTIQEQTATHQLNEVHQQLQVSGGTKVSDLVAAAIKLKVKPSEEKEIADRTIQEQIVPHQLIAVQQQLPVSGGTKLSDLVPAVIKVKVEPSEEKENADRTIQEQIATHQLNEVQQELPVSGGTNLSDLVPAVIKVKVEPSEEKEIADRTIQEQIATHQLNEVQQEVSPAFLHGNSTSHTWPFSAIAELIDNAYDPDVSASELWIDKRTVNRTECMTFVDNGNGMNDEKLYKMLSFGYCEKVPVGNVKPIGYYGNGFKSGSMRLGQDALVFTRCLTSTSVGYLSQSYLKAINAEAVIVPIVTWDFTSNGLTRKETPESTTNLKAILKYSVFQTEKELMAELKALEKMRTGTNIIIFNLKRDNTDNLELDFSSDPQDIRNPETPVIDLTSINRPIYTASPEYRRSLREYCSILYLKPRMKIVLRGQKVKTKLISKSLSQTEVDVYKPTWLSRPIKLTFGFTDNKEPDSYGLMMYHKNRLIRAYEKIGCQKQANDHGVGVIGVVEANFLEPIHNKQDFNKTDKYLAFMQNAASKLNDYFYEKTQCENPNTKNVQPSQLPDWTWAQCDNCLSWRRLPTGYREKLPDKWYCYLNPDAHFNRCDIPEEPEDDDEALQPTYRKTYRKTMAEKNRQTRFIEERKIKEKEEQLRKKEEMLKTKLKELTWKETALEEVSSSQDKVDRKPTVADLVRAKKSLQVYQEKMAMQEKTIKQLEYQKKQIEQKSTAMLRMAESLKINSIASKNLEEKVKSMTGTSSSAVSSSSHSLRPPAKRKSNSSDGSREKVAKIKTEDGSFISVRMDESVVDLTLDEEEMEGAFDLDSGEASPDNVNKVAETTTEAKTTVEPSENTTQAKTTVEPSETTTPAKTTVEPSENTTQAKTTVNPSENDSDKSNKAEKGVKTVEDKTKDESIVAAKTSEKGDSSLEDKNINEKSEISKDKNEGKEITGTDERESSMEDEGEVNTDNQEVGKNDQDGANSSEKEKDKKNDKELKECSENKTESISYTEMQAEDIKPDKEDLDKKLNDTKTDRNSRLHSKEENKSTSESKEEKKVFVHKAAQTVPTVVKFASPEEVDLLKLCPIEQKQALLEKARELDDTKKELSDTKNTLKGLQDNIWQLLKIIVPDFDYGDPENIEKVILDFIRVNGEHNDGPSTSGS